MESGDRSLLALLLLAPVPTLGIAAVLLWLPGPIGRALFVAAKIWLLVLPVAWHLTVDSAPLSWSPPRQGGLGIGFAIGLVTAAVIAAAYLVVAGPGIDPTLLRRRVADMGLSSRRAFLAGALFWIFVNSVVEEYVFRWFVQSRCERLMRRVPAILTAAALFTAHHVVALATYFDPGVTVLASAGVFVGGATWGWLYDRYRSIWPGWIAHAVADVAVFTCGWLLLFA